MAKNKKKNFTKRVVFRSLIIAFLLLGLIPLLAFMGSYLGKKVSGEQQEKADALDSCEYSYYEGDYATLLNDLNLYDCEEEDSDFAKYWEMARAYEAYQHWKVYREGTAIPGLSQEEQTQYSEKAAEYEKTVRGYLTNTTDSENKVILEELVKEIDQAA